MINIIVCTINPNTPGPPQYVVDDDPVTLSKNDPVKANAGLLAKTKKNTPNNNDAHHFCADVGVLSESSEENEGILENGLSDMINLYVIIEILFELCSFEKDIKD